jgi:hypothetical protein
MRTPRGRIASNVWFRERIVPNKARHLFIRQLFVTRHAQTDTNTLGAQTRQRHFTSFFFPSRHSYNFSF